MSWMRERGRLSFFRFYLLFFYQMQQPKSAVPQSQPDQRTCGQAGEKK